MKIKRSLRNLCILPLVPIYIMIALSVRLLQSLGDFGYWLESVIYDRLPKLDVDWSEEIQSQYDKVKDGYFRNTQRSDNVQD